MLVLQEQKTSLYCPWHCVHAVFRAQHRCRLLESEVLHRAIEDDFWALSGGRVEHFENSNITIEREIIEELGLECKVVQHLWHVENFFKLSSRKIHELAIYFLVSLISPPVMKSEIDFKGIETSVNLLFRWIPLTGLGDYNLKPEFLVKKLSDIPKSIEFVRVNEINV
jgi:8-oxo-dGTP pyrophosphatase MutT (NUDIX family)